MPFLGCVHKQLGFIVALFLTAYLVLKSENKSGIICLFYKVKYMIYNLNFGILR